MESRESTWYARRRRGHPIAPFHHTAAKISSLTTAFGVRAGTGTYLRTDVDTVSPTRAVPSSYSWCSTPRPQRPSWHRLDEDKADLASHRLHGPQGRDNAVAHSLVCATPGEFEHTFGWYPCVLGELHPCMCLDRRDSPALACDSDAHIVVFSSLVGCVRDPSDPWHMALLPGLPLA